MYTLYTVSCSPASGSQQTTTLYPVNRTVDLKQQETVYNKHIHKQTLQQSMEELQVKTDKNDDINELNNNSTKQDQPETNIQQPNDDKQTSTLKTDEEIVIDDTQKNDDIDQKLDSKTNAVANGVKNEVTTWSLESNYSQGDEKDEKDFKEDQKKIIKEFRPSPHLGSFYDEDAFALTTQASVVPWSPYTKPSGFMRSPQDFYKLNYKKPIDVPYKFEANSAFPDPTYWKHHTGLESKPTDSVPVKTPAGGLYKSPVLDPGSQEYGLSYKEEGKGNSHKKGLSPWKSFLQLASALLPVGLIVSALTPSVVTLQSADNTPYYGNRVTRRVEGFQRLPVISEACKRRLLCALHAGHRSDEAPTGHKHCYKLQCEDPAAMETVLRFLWTHRPAPPVGGLPGAVVPLE